MEAESVKLPLLTLSFYKFSLYRCIGVKCSDYNIHNNFPSVFQDLDCKTKSLPHSEYVERKGECAVRLGISTHQYMYHANNVNAFKVIQYRTAQLKMNLPQIGELQARLIASIYYQDTHVQNLFTF